MNWSNSWEKWRLVLWWTRTYIFKGLCCDSLYSLCYIDCSLYCFKTRLLKTRLGSPKTNTCINLALSSNYRGASCTCGGWKKSLDIWPKWFWKSVPIFDVGKYILSGWKCIANERIDLKTFYQWKWTCSLVKRYLRKGNIGNKSVKSMFFVLNVKLFENVLLERQKFPGRLSLYCYQKQK